MGHGRLAFNLVRPIRGSRKDFFACIDSTQKSSEDAGLRGDGAGRANEAFGEGRYYTSLLLPSDQHSATVLHP